MANFYQVFGDGPVCVHAKSYCEYEGDVEPVCGLFKHGTLFCFKCDKYEPKVKHAHWEAHYECSNCGESVRTLQDECPFCHAVMDERL